MTLRVVSWNCRRAKPGRPLWQYLEELAPDVAVLQEVGALPDQVRESYHVWAATPPTQKGHPQRFQSAMLIRGTIEAELPLRSGLAWVDRELSYFAANLSAHRVRIGDRPPLVVVSVYSPPWPVAKARLKGEDVSSVKLVQNPDVWVADLLVPALRNGLDGADSEWVVAGDFNACETLDSWKSGPRGNREWLDRMGALGLTECLRQAEGMLTPTFRRAGIPKPHAQLDYVFVTKGLAAGLEKCRTGDAERVYGTRMSDHLPVVADFSDISPDAA